MATDYYGVLGVARDASDADLKKAYRRLARELHPDVNPDADAQVRFQQISAAYEVLSDPEKRQVVDLGGDPLAAGGGSGAGGSPFAGFGFGDIMDAFFGGNGSGRGPRSRVRPGADALLRLELDLTETAFGVTREVAVDTAVRCGTCDGEGTAPGTSPATCPVCEGRGEVQSVQRSFLGQVMTARVCPRCAGTGSIIPTPCPTCDGDGRVRARRTLAVRVPAGVEDGMRIRLSGEGEVGQGGGPAGDLYVEVVERAHQAFHREGDDLHVEVSLPMTAAALGTTVALETLDGEESLEIRAGTQPGAVLTLAGRGTQHLRAAGRGDLHAHIVVQTPTRLDGRQEELLRELAALRGEEHPDGSGPGSGLLGRLRHLNRR